MIFIRSIRCQAAAAAAAAAARFEKARDIIVPIFALIEVQSCKIMS